MGRSSRRTLKNRKGVLIGESKTRAARAADDLIARGGDITGKTPT